MLTAEENDLLCRVEGQAPMGQLMCRHWIPACLSEDVAERDGAPVRVRLLGEDLVAFRDSGGRVGVLDERCPHRKASLVHGRNEECGLRCLYHGWKIDVDGNVLEMPSEPPGSRFAGKVRHKAYPAREAGGFVWAYMGPVEAMPEFEPPAFAPTPATKVSIVKMRIAANWAQIMEGQIDSSHSSSLHSTDMRPAQVDSAKAADTHWLRPSTDKSPRMQVQFTPYGMRYAAIRRPIMNPDTHDYVRITTYIAPFVALIPPNTSYNVTSVIVPRDDVSSDFHFLAWGGSDIIGRDAWRRFCVAEVGVDLDAEYRPTLRRRDNHYLQDRAAMKRGDFTGIEGIPNQDMAMWESMGPISDRTTERLGASDIAVIQWRRLMVEAARRFAGGGPAIGTMPPRIPQAEISAYQGIVEKAVDWRTLGASPQEIASYARQESAVA